MTLQNIVLYDLSYDQSNIIGVLLFKHTGEKFFFLSEFRPNLILYIYNLISVRFIYF